MLQYKVSMKKDNVTYTELLEEGSTNEVSAQDMYTAMQENSNKKYFSTQKWIFGILGFIIFPQMLMWMNIDFFTFPALFCWIGLFIFYRKGKKAQRTNVEFDIDSNGEKRMNAVKEAFDFVNNADEVFPSAGLWSIIFLDTNVDIYGWEDPTDNDEIFFMPDVCLVNVKQSGFSAIEYEKMHSGYTDSKDTAQYPPSDSEILGKTWLHTRKDGQPDLRYTDNPTVYSIKKGFTLISDDPRFKDSGDSNFSAGLIISSPSIAKDFNSKMKNIFSSGGISTSKQKKSVKPKEKPDSLSKAFDSKTESDDKPEDSNKGKDDGSDPLSKAFGSKTK